MTTKEYVENNAETLNAEAQKETVSLIDGRLKELREQWLQEIFSRYPDSKEQSSRVIIPVGKREVIIPIPLI